MVLPLLPILAQTSPTASNWRRTRGSTNTGTDSYAATAHRLLYPSSPGQAEVTSITMGSPLLLQHPFDADYEFLSLQIPPEAPHVTIVTLNRPRKLNAIHSSFWKEIGHAFARLGRNTDGDKSRCLLLNGAGRGFCAGIDVSDLSFTVSHSGDTTTAVDPARQGLALQTKVREMQACFTQLETCPIPVVAALHGLCIGAGIDLACCADIRIAQKGCIFSVREVKMGLAADVGTLQRLPKITGNASWVSDVCLTGRNFDSQEALSSGFVSQVIEEKNQRETTGDIPVSFLRHSIRLCHAIAKNSPVAVVGTKQAILYARDHTVADGLEQIISYNALALQSRDLMQSIEAAAEKRQASFPDLLPHSRL